MFRSVFILLFLSIFIQSSLFAQSSQLNQSVEYYKKDALANGYTIMDSGGGNINNEFGLIFDVQDYYPGQYYIIAIIDDCSSCKVQIYITDLDSGVENNRSPAMEYRGSVGFSGFSFTQNIYGKGRIAVAVNNSYYVYGYTLLLKKSL